MEGVSFDFGGRHVLVTGGTSGIGFGVASAFADAGAEVRITVLGSAGGQVRIGVEAPREVSVHREEVFERIAGANREAARTEEAALRAWLGEEGEGA